MTLLTLDPTGVKQVDIHPIAPRLETLQGTTIGVLHNVKKNAKELLNEMANVLQERYEIKEVIGPELTDGRGGMLSSPEQLDELSKKVDLVLTGLGD
jgi:hypothetical protein